MSLAPESDVRVAFVYDDDAHDEPGRSKPAAALQPNTGLFGRHVANSEFLEAWLQHGDWQHMVGVVSNQASSNSLARRFGSSARAKENGRRLDIIGLPHFQDRFFPTPPAQVLHLPHPIDPEFGWWRHHKAAHAFALSGVTHTISLKGVMERFRELVTGPFEQYDTLFCISRATVAVVRAAADNYAAFLRERHGGDPRLRVRLAHVPFGIDTDKFHPATTEERSSARHALGLAPDEICLLFVGRLSYYSKVHPFPMYRAAAEAARRTGCKVHLVLAGWADSPSILEKFQQGARVVAPSVRVTFVDAMRPDTRFRVWHAADVFTSMSDNIQETLGLTILEAQASGLPVVTTDWDGCRESIAPNETGFLVSTRMVTGATIDSTSRHLMGEINYGEFLGETNQAVAVDTVEAANAFERLFADASLRARMGAAGRERIASMYNWPLIVQQYQSVWREQELVRREHAALATASPVRTPVPFPDVEYLFASYPSALLAMSRRVVATDDALTQLPILLGLPITNYLPHARIVDQPTLNLLLKAARSECTLDELGALLAVNTPSVPRQRRTLAWLLKYDLLRVVPLE